MDGKTKIAWDFAETAFRTGTLDKILDLVSLLTANDSRDMAQITADLEDVFIEMEDTGPMEERFGQVYEVLEALTDEDILEGIGILLSVATPVISMLVLQSGGETPFSADKQDELKESVRKVVKALKAVGGIGVKNFKAFLSEKSPRQIGHDIGKSINSTSALVNGIYEKDSHFFSDLMAGIFSEADGEAFKKMNLIFADGLMEQKPPFLKLTTAMMMKSTRKRLLKK